MGLWVQNVGVQAEILPPSLATRAAAESFGLPEPIPRGWTWTSLRGEYEGAEFLELQELDDVVAAAAAEAPGPALGFSVHDSDSVYLVGADADRLRFRVAVNADSFDDEPPELDAGAVVGWAREYAPRTPTAEELATALKPHYVLAEEGLAILLARMGMLPPDAAVGAETMDAELPDEEPLDDETGDEERGVDPARLAVVQTPNELVLGENRWYAASAIEGWQLVAAQRELSLAQIMGFDSATFAKPFGMEGIDVDALLDVKRPIFVGYACAAGGAISEVDFADNLRQLTRTITELGLGQPFWREVPPAVGRTLAETAAWVVAQAA